MRAVAIKRFAGVVAFLVIACAGRTDTDGGSGGVGGTAPGGFGGGGGAGGFGGSGGTPCKTKEGVRLCGGNGASCGWVGPEDCPGGGCARPYDRILGGDSASGVCFSDLADNGSRACLHCEDGEVCLERAKGELVCVPESVCAALWALGAKGVCRYADLTAYDGRPLPVLPQCPSPNPGGMLCGGPCPKCSGDPPYPCTGRSPDHPQGFCTSSVYDWCALADSGGYTQPCVETLPKSLCAVFRDAAVDASVARHHGRCMGDEMCLQLSAALPGGLDCYDEKGAVVPAGK